MAKLVDSCDQADGEVSLVLLCLIVFLVGLTEFGITGDLYDCSWWHSRGLVDSLRVVTDF